MNRIIAVLDIGKTNVKLCALDKQTGDTVSLTKRNNKPLISPPYPHVDVDGIWDWYCLELKKLSKRFYIESLCCTTHGATVACLSRGSLAFPIYDYESDLCEECNQLYASVRPTYDETLSPDLSGGLNIGRQLFWLATNEPEKFKSVDTILLYPQYWAWRLTGIAVSEVTSLGCHTDLWAPLSGTYSSLVKRMGWHKCLPTLRAAGDSLGPVSNNLKKTLDLPDDCQVINGIHDSNASLIPYLQSESQPFTVISSGTWTVIGNIGSSIENLTEEADMLCNVNAYGEPVPCIRFMGGREWEILKGDQSDTIRDLSTILESNVFILPCYANQGGPFQHMEGTTIGPVGSLTSAQRTALASLYCALVTDYCLCRIKSSGLIIVEGSLASNQTFLTVLKTLRKEQNIHLSTDTTGTTIGAARLIDGCQWPKKEPTAVVDTSKIDVESVLSYREQWQAAITTHN